MFPSHRLPAALLLVSLAILPSLAPAEGRPNVLLLIADDLTATTLGCYGSAQAHTPHLDRLASEGVQFNRAYCQFPVCGPSRAALMSGLYPQQNGVVGNGSSSKLAATLGERPTLGQHFRNSGYRSTRVSKIYHMRVPGDITAGVDGPDHLATWDERFNCQAPEWMTEGKAEHLTNTKLTFDPDGHYKLGFGWAFYVIESPGEGIDQADHKAATKAIEVLREQEEDSDPFFLAVGFVRPHVPLVAPESFYEPFPAEAMDLPVVPDGDLDDIPAAGISKTSKGSGLDGKPLRQKKVLRGYHASVSFMDAQVGRILEALDETGLAESTIVVFKSDHGYHLGEHHLWQKMSLHEESVRIPLIVRAPGVSPGETSALTEAIDLFPTLSELAGLEVPEHCVGTSLVPVLRDTSTSVREEVYSFRGDGHLIRTDGWAYMRYRKGGEELYDMQRDPKQFSNLANDPASKSALDTMRQRLESRLAKF